MKYRPEIDGLRALAVSLVIGFHFLPSLFEHGYLGVDIFFVISGFVISGSLWHLEKTSVGVFLEGFWSRRIKRLIPALIVCIVLMSVLLLLLTSRPSKEMFATGGMSLIGLSNIYLYFKAADYFALDAQLNPFTHTWSLGVEEQFYLLFPLLAFGLGIVARPNSASLSRTFGFLLVIFIISGVGFLMLGGGQDIASFYLSPFRFWELLAGVIAFLCFQKNIDIPQPAFYITALCVGIGLFFPVLPSELRIVLTVLATAIFMASLKGVQENVIVSVLKWNPVNYIGRLSYSLYLYHWPLYVIAALTIGHAPIALLICLLLTFILSALSYHFIETPLRKDWGDLSNKRTVLTGLSVAVPLACLFIFGVHKMGARINNTLPSIAGISRTPSWSKLPCHGEIIVDSYKNPLKKCLGEMKNGRGGDIYLLGDSHAAQLTFMLKKLVSGTERKLFFINTGRATDFPYAYWRETNVQKDRVIKHVLRVSDPDDIVVLSFHRGHLNNPKYRDRHVSLTEQITPNKHSENFAKNMRLLVEKVQKADLKLVLFADTPLMSYVTTIETCAFQSKLLGRNSCAVMRVQDEHTRARQVQVFKSLSSTYPSQVFYFDPFIYFYGSKMKFDPVKPDGTYRMVDWNHIPKNESEALSEPFRRFLQANGL